MHRIDTNGSIAGLFQEGNPNTGQQATQLGAAWFNDFQENILGVLDAAAIGPVKGDWTQLADAIVALVAGSVGTGGGEVPTTRIVAGGGLVTGGGNLAVDRTLTVTAATPAEVSAGVLNTVVLTPLSAAGLIGAAFTGGLQLQLGPVLVQIFTGTAGGNANTVLTLPEAFGTACIAAFANGGAMVANAQDNGPWVSGVGLTTVSVYNSIDSAVSVQIIAIGH